jgi:hypothetical protein
VLRKPGPPISKKVDVLTRRWLSKTPELLAAYLVWRNGALERRGVAFFAMPVLVLAWVAAAFLYVRVHRAAAASTLAWIHRHDLFWSAVIAIVSAILVSRRRVLTRSEAPRAGTTAWPIARSAARWQAVVRDSLPAIRLVGFLAATFGGLSLAAVIEGGTMAPIITWAAMTGGVVLGAALSYLLPSVAQEEIYEASRYVPQRRRGETPIPIGSLAALGSWPVRQMFASARPKVITRVAGPLLLAVPLGSQAADVMVTVGLLTALGAIIALVAAVISVSARASRWVKPLPLGLLSLVRRTLGPAVASMLVAAVIETWLIWILGSTVSRSVAEGILTLAAGVISAVVGCLVAVRAHGKVTHGPP